MNRHNVSEPGVPEAARDARTGLTAARMVHDVGIEINGGRAIVLLAAESRTPCARAMTFTTVADGQRAIEIRVVRCAPRGEPDRIIGRFLLTGLRPGPRGEARIDIGLSLDRQGVLRAWAGDRGSGARQEACFAGAWALAPEARPQALAALRQTVDNEGRRAVYPSLRREREGIEAWVRAGRPEDRERISADCGLALATLTGEIESLNRSLRGAAVPAAFDVPRSQNAPRASMKDRP